MNLYVHTNAKTFLEEKGEVCCRYVEESEVPTWFWCGNLKARSHLNDLGVNGKILLQFILKKSFGRTWNSCIWFWLGTRGEFFLKLWWKYMRSAIFWVITQRNIPQLRKTEITLENICSTKMRRFSWLTEKRYIFQEEQ